MKPCEFGSIRSIHQRLIHEGYHVSEYLLRQWIKNGTLPAVYSGNKALISYGQVLDLLNAPLTTTLATNAV